MMKRLFATLSCAALLLAGAPARAQDPAAAYPSGPISLVVCYTPGGATDLQARLSALSRRTKSISASPSSSSTSRAPAA